MSLVLMTIAEVGMAQDGERAARAGMAIWQSMVSRPRVTAPTRIYGLARRNGFISFDTEDSHWDIAENRPSAAIDFGMLSNAVNSNTRVRIFYTVTGDGRGVRYVVNKVESE